MGIIGIAYLIGLYVSDAYGVGPLARGLILGVFGLCALVFSRLSGTLVDRIGPRWCAFGGAGGGALLLAALALTNHEVGIGVVVAVWAAMGLLASLFTISITTLSTSAVPTNRGGATSLVQAFRFAGMALSPFVLLPLYAASSAASLLVAGAMALFAALTIVTVPSRLRRPPAEPGGEFP